MTPGAAGAPVRGLRPRDLSRLRRLRGWNAAVAGSVVVLAIASVSVAISWIATHKSRTTRYAIATPVTQVILAVSSGTVEIAGGAGTSIGVERRDQETFGRGAREQRSVSGGVLRLSSQCPHIIVGSCSSSYRLSVPDGVSVSVTTADGNVDLRAFSGTASIDTGAGAIEVRAFCGFGLSARSRTGDIHVLAACAPKSLELRSVSGDAVALVPPGRYRVRAVSLTGSRSVAGVLPNPTAPFHIDVESRSGAVAVEGGL